MIVTEWLTKAHPNAACMITKIKKRMGTIVDTVVESTNQVEWGNALPVIALKSSVSSPSTTGSIILPAYYLKVNIWVHCKHLVCSSFTQILNDFD